MFRRFARPRLYAVPDTGPSFVSLTNDLGRMIQILRNIGRQVAPLGPFAPPCVALPYEAMRENIANAVVNLSTKAGAMPAGDERDVYLAVAAALAKEVVLLPSMERYWQQAPVFWMYVGDSPVRPTGKPLGSAWDWLPLPPGGADAIEQAWEHRREVNWWDLHLRVVAFNNYASGAAAGVVAWMVGGAAASFYIWGTLAIQVAQSTWQGIQDAVRAQQNLGASFLNEHQTLIAKFYGKFLPEVYQQVRAVNKIVTDPNFSLITDNDKRFVAFLRSMLTTNPYDEPTMPAGWDGSFPEFRDRSALLAIGVLGAMLAGVALVASRGD